jgi:hypothetical protein
MKEDRMRTTLTFFHLVFLFSLMAVGAGCASPAHKDGTVSRGENVAILDEINAARTWFHAKKVRPIWVKQLEHDQTVKTLEGIETVKAGDYLCRGEAGDIWPQKAKSLESKYTKTQETDAEGWSKYVPRPDAQGVLAAQVAHAFQVHAKWGVLTGKPGDYIVKNYADRDVAYPTDVWIVDRALFKATYQAVGENP